MPLVITTNTWLVASGIAVPQVKFDLVQLDSQAIDVRDMPCRRRVRGFQLCAQTFVLSPKLNRSHPKTPPSHQYADGR